MTNHSNDITAARAAVKALRDAGNAATPGRLRACRDEALPVTATEARAWAAAIRTCNALDGKDLSRRDSGPPPLNDVGRVGAKLADALDDLADARDAAIPPAICDILLAHLDAHEAAEASWEANLRTCSESERVWNKACPPGDITYMRAFTAKLAALQGEAK